MFLSKLGTVSRLLPGARLILIVPLLVTLLAACGNGTGGGPAY
jgi:hypothetical protein